MKRAAAARVSPSDPRFVDCDHDNDTGGVGAPPLQGNGNDYVNDTDSDPSQSALRPVS